MAFSLIVAILVSVGMIVSILKFPRIKLGRLSFDAYWAISLAGAFLLLVSGKVNLKNLAASLTESSPVNPIKILLLFLSMTLLSVFLDEVGFFRYLASKTLKLAKHSQVKLFVLLYVVVSILTVFTSNDVVILTFTPFLCYFAKHAGIRELPYLVAEFVAANTMSMTLLIGNPTNIYIATTYHIGFGEYAGVMILPTLAGSIVAFLILFLIFRKDLRTPAAAVELDATITSKPELILGLVALGTCTILLAVGPYFGLELWLISLCSAVILFAAVAFLSALHKRKPTELKHAFLRAPWQLVPFVLSMFVIVQALSEAGVTDALSSLFGSEQPILRYGVSSFFASNLINNIPMSVFFCPVLGPVASLGGTAAKGAVFSTIVGSNLGAYLTPVGALAGILWMSLLKKQGVKFGYLDFVRYGAAVSIPTLVATLSVLSLVI
ncbi:MAG: hypothetical protein IJR88_02030 [Clostridia bacterium]|nr:hypothetical protein [Clostridia bacterium]